MNKFSRRAVLSLNYPIQKKILHLSQKAFKASKENDDFEQYHCLKLVQKNDHENFLCTLLLNGDERRDALALRAFNVEVSKCNDKVTQGNIAQMRLKFWYDAIDKCFSKKRSYVSDHPVLRELKHTIDKNDLSKMYLKRLIAARERPLNKHFKTMEEMEGYADQAFSSLYHLLTECKNIKDIHVDHAVSHLGKAQGIATLLRSIPHKGRDQALNIPQEVLTQHGVSQERFLRHNANDKPVEDCVYQVASTAFEHLNRARKLQDKVPPSIRKIFLPAVAVERYLERLRKANFRLTDSSCLERDNLLPMSLYWHGIRGQY